MEGSKLPRLNRRRNHNSLHMITNIKVGGKRALKEAQDDIKDDETLDFNITIEDMAAQDDQSHHVKMSSDRQMTSAISNIRSYNCSPNHSPSKMNGSSHHCKFLNN